MLQVFRTAALLVRNSLALSLTPLTLSMSCLATIRWYTRSLAALSIPTASRNVTTSALQEFAALVQEFAGLEAPKTDSEADLTIWPEFLKPTKSVWANRFSKRVPSISRFSSSCYVARERPIWLMPFIAPQSKTMPCCSIRMTSSPIAAYMELSSTTTFSPGDIK